MDRIVSQFLAELDGMSSEKVFLIGATNRPDLIDPALLRPGRFERLVYVGPPSDEASRLAILTAQTRHLKLDDGVNLTRVLRKCPSSMTGAEFYALCTEAVSNAMRRAIAKFNGDVDADVFVCESDFELAVKTVVAATNEAAYDSFRDLKTNYG
jgi:peroxin-6